ncbi:MAG: hypothetical protein LKF32_05270 [Mageeibacillus sp.]|jgi:uncharacterized protein YjdB|nr:hypothetical protein [Mageeibacillus sp.]MCI1264087.1 hypothetical protein [Saccharofermentans sp.]MCI1768602.1 hypothetical protein [Mageeibacillus sp.]
MNHFKNLVSVICAAAILATACFTYGSRRVSADTVSYSLDGVAHVQDIGDANGSFDSGVLTLGTEGQSKRLEAVTVNFTNNTGFEGTLQYRVHVQNIGWMDWHNAGEAAGTQGQSLRLEGIEMRLTGELANHYSVMYATHIQDYGDAQGWVSNGALAGTTGESKRLEELKVKLTALDSANTTSVSYRVHRQDYGWETSWAADGAVSGTTGQAKRLEAISISLNSAQYTGGIEYRTHIQDIGWEDSWSSNGEMSGTQGQAKRLETIQIRLTGDIANYYDVYYRVHAQNLGWMGWACDGASSGTTGSSSRLEAIQIVLVLKGAAAPGAVAGVITDYADAYSDRRTDRVYFDDFIKNYKRADTLVGIDVSKWQGTIDFQAVRNAGAEFVIIRAYKCEYHKNSRGTYVFDSYVDPYFLQNIRNAKAAGLAIGVYYGAADNSEAMVRDHARTIAQLLNSTGITLDIPVAYDWEQWQYMSQLGLNYTSVNALWRAFADEMSKNGYPTILYSSKWYLENVWDYSGHDVWLANYVTRTDYKGPYFMWQATSKGVIPGIITDTAGYQTVDFDVYYQNGVNK